jgi:ankyrin repeat protein
MEQEKKNERDEKEKDNGVAMREEETAVGEDSKVEEADVTLDTSAEAELSARNNGSTATVQSFLELDEEAEVAEKEAKSVAVGAQAAASSTEDGMSSQDEGGTTSQDDDDDEQIILNSSSAPVASNSCVVIDVRECSKKSVVIRPRITKAKEDEDVQEDDDKENAVDDDEEEDDEGDEDEEEDPLVAGAAAAKASGDVDKWVSYLDETDPCHKLRSLCKKGDIEGLAKLLDIKNPDVDIDSVSEEGWTSLHEIITHECQFTEVARVLLRFGANVNTQDLHGDSPLHSALLYHNLDNISLLLGNNADHALINAGGRMPVHVADEVETLGLLLENKAGLADAQDRVGNTPLHYAVAARDKERIALLLKYKPNVNLANRSGSTPLHLTADAEVAALLMSAGADANQPDCNANTPLHLAVRGRRKEIVRVMLEKMADISLVNASGKTPLNLAKDREMKNILLRKPTAASTTTEASVPLPAGPTAKKGKNSASSSAAGSPVPPAPSFMEKFAESIVIPECSSPSILKKRKRVAEKEDEDEVESAKKMRGPRLRFSDVNDYSGVEVVEEAEKRVKVTPLYIEQAFSSDDD